LSTSQAALRGPVALIIATTPWPLSARLAVRLIRHGCTVDALCPRGHALRKISGVRALHSYSAPDPMVALERAMAASTPDILVPCDDRTVWQLHVLHQRRPDLRQLIERSMGAPQAFPVLRSRAGLMQRAAEMGLRVPRTRAIGSNEDILAWFRDYPGKAVLKLDGSWGGTGVRVVASAQEAESAWQEFARPRSRLVAWKRSLVDHDPLAFGAGYAPQPQAMSLQEFIPGHPANTMVAAWQGRLLGMVSVDVLCAQDPTAPSTIVRLIQNEEMARTSATLVSGLGLSGFHGLDFILAEGTNAPHLIEVNPRCTQLGHLVLPEQGDLAGMLCAQLGCRLQSQPDAVVAGSLVAFYPQALACNPCSPHLAQSHHDVPWEEPRLVRTLIHNRWVARQWLARVYGWLRGKESNPVPSIVGFLRSMAQSGHHPGHIDRLSDVR
jgi:predicted ATP-grasp superfamily ATP-dependent carboligase